jgi:hypothetical protein
MGEPCGGHRLFSRTEMGDGVRDVGGVPEHDRGDDEVEAGRTNCCASALRSAIRPCLPALFEGADDLREETTLLALVEPGMAASAQFRAFEPVEHEQRAFDPPQLLECEVELVLAAVGREFSQHNGRRHDAGLQRRAPYRCGRVRLLRIGRNSGPCSSSPWPAASRSSWMRPLPLPRSLLPESSAGSGASSCIGFGSSAGRHACHHLLALMGCKTLPRVPVSRTRRPETASRRARA